jgi:hypothetical protein
LNGEEVVRVSRVGLRGKLLAGGEVEAGSWGVVHWAGRGFVMQCAEAGVVYRNQQGSYMGRRRLTALGGAIMSVLIVLVHETHFT